MGSSWASSNKTVGKANHHNKISFIVFVTYCMQTDICYTCPKFHNTTTTQFIVSERACLSLLLSQTSVHAQFYKANFLYRMYVYYL